MLGLYLYQEARGAPRRLRRQLVRLRSTPWRTYRDRFYHRPTVQGRGHEAWVSIRYPEAVWDDEADRCVSHAQIAKIPYTAFASTNKYKVTADLIVRRVKDLNAAAGQGELFETWRYHAIFTDNPHELITAEAEHRDHAIVEQVISDLYDGPLAHLQITSSRFAANACWLTLAALTHNLLRATGTLASVFHGKARGATLRRHLINVPARLARHGRGNITLHLLTATHRAPPTPAA